MTSPVFARTNHGKGHSYTLHGRRVPGVTSVIGVLDKPALIDWAVRVTTEFAVNNWAGLSELPILERSEQLTRARWNQNKAAIVTGHRIHAMGDRLARGETLTDVPAELLGQVEAYARFLDAWEIDTLATEVPVCHTGYRYAGTADLVCRVGKLDGLQLVMDVKTGRKVYAETALQLCAYRNADVLLRSVPQAPGPRGGKRPPLLIDEPMIPTVGGAVAHVIAPDADTPARVDFVPVDTGPEVWAAFLYLLEIHQTWIARTQDHKSDIYAPPVGEPLYPENAEAHPFYDEEGQDDE